MRRAEQLQLQERLCNQRRVLLRLVLLYLLFHLPQSTLGLFVLFRTCKVKRLNAFALCALHFDTGRLVMRVADLTFLTCQRLTHVSDRADVPASTSL